MTSSERSGRGRYVGVVRALALMGSVGATGAMGCAAAVGSDGGSDAVAGDSVVVAPGPDVVARDSVATSDAGACPTIECNGAATRCTVIPECSGFDPCSLGAMWCRCESGGGCSCSCPGGPLMPPELGA